MREVDRAHQPQRDRHGHRDDRADIDRAPEQRDCAERAAVGRAGAHRVRGPVCAEQEIDRRHHSEKAHGFEHKAGNDADRGQDRDQRGYEQHAHDRPLNPCTCGEIRAQAQEREGTAGKGNHQRDDEANGVIARKRGSVGFDKAFRLAVEHRAGCTGGHRTGLAHHRLALEPESGECRSRRIRQHRLEHEARADRIPQQREQQGRHGDPQTDVPGVEIGQRVDPPARCRLAEGPGPRASRQPANKTQPEGQKEQNAWRHGPVPVLT